MAALLREHYDTSWLPPSVVQHILRIEIDRGRGRATLHLDDGSQLIDSGDRVLIVGVATDRAIRELMAAADRHGWSQPGGSGVRLFGSADFRRRAAVEFLDRASPPQITGLDEADQKAVANELRQRADRRRQEALAVLAAAEQRALAACKSRPGDKTAVASLATIRDGQAAVAAGDDATIRAAAVGDLALAMKAASGRKRLPVLTIEAMAPEERTPAYAPAYTPSRSMGPKVRRR